MRGSDEVESIAPIGREQVVWGYRLFLDREPESELAISQKLVAHGSTADLRRDFLASEEFRRKNVSDLAYTSARCIVIKELTPGLRLFVDLSDVAIGLNVVRDNYELSESRFIADMLRPGDSALDIGANIGFHTIRMASYVGPSGRVHAFEPLPQNIELLERSVRENGFQDRVVLEHAAVGASPGEAEMVFLSLEEGAFNSGGAYLRKAGRELPPLHHAVSVRVVALDQCDLRRPVRFIKIDVEGAEPLALRGAGNLLQSDRPTILSEINPARLFEVAGRSAPAFIAEMEKLRYECRVLEEGRPGAAIHDVSDDRIRSVVFLPR